MKRSVKHSYMLLFFITVFLLSACSQTSTDIVPSKAAEVKKEKDTLVIVQATETRDFNSIDPTSKDLSLPRTLIYETLVTRDSTGKIIPLLAESFEQKDLTLRLHLRKGIKFHLGDEFNADSVKATFDKVMSPEVKGLYKTFFASVAEVRVVDASTVDIINKTANYSLLNYLVDLPILSAKTLANADSYKTEMNGTGPYLMDVWKRGEKAELKQNPNYWSDKPPFKSVVIKNIPEQSTRIAELLSGSADIASDIGVSSIPRIKNQAGFHVESEPGYRVTYMSYSLNKAPLDNVKLRQAIYYAVDRKGLSEKLFGEYAVAATSLVTKGSSGYAEAFPLGDYNLEKAKQLVKESGVTLPISLEFDVQQKDLDTAQVVQEQLKTIGIMSNINIRESAGFFDAKRFEERKTGSILLFTGFDNPDREINRLFGPAYSSEASTFTGLGWKPIPEMSQLIQQYTSEPDEPKRTELSKRIQALGKSDSSINWLLFPSNLYGMSDSIVWKPDGSGRIDIKSIKVK
jgi:peptide/nickel transport system substrate-binding protein